MHVRANKEGTPGNNQETEKDGCQRAVHHESRRQYDSAVSGDDDGRECGAGGRIESRAA